MGIWPISHTNISEVMAGEEAWSTISISVHPKEGLRFGICTAHLSSFTQTLANRGPHFVHRGNGMLEHACTKLLSSYVGNI